MNRLIVSIGLGLLLFAASANAQTPAAGDELSSRLKEGEKIRIAEASGAVTAGQLAQLSRDSVIVRTSAGDREVSLGDITELTVRRRSTGRGFFAGAFTGAVMGALVGCADQSGGFGPEPGCGQVIGTAAVAGGAIGAISGSFFSHDVTVYRAPNAKVQVSVSASSNSSALVRFRW